MLHLTTALLPLLVAGADFRPVPQSGAMRTFVLSVGVSYYLGNPTRLRVAATHAQNIGSEFRRQGAFVVTLCDSEATRAGIADAIADFASIAGKSDKLVIYFFTQELAADGSPSVKTFDSQEPTKPNQGLRWPEIRELVQASGCGQALVIQDIYGSSSPLSPGFGKDEMGIQYFRAKDSAKYPLAPLFGKEIHGVIRGLTLDDLGTAFADHAVPILTIPPDSVILYSRRKVSGSGVRIGGLFGTFQSTGSRKPATVTILEIDRVRFDLPKDQDLSAAAGGRAASRSAPWVRTGIVPILGEVQSTDVIGVTLNGLAARLHTVGDALVFSGEARVVTGSNELRVEVTYQKRSSDTFTFKLEGRTAISVETVPRTYRALIFGTSTYGPGLLPLPNPKNDATALKLALEESYSFMAECILDPTWEVLMSKLTEEYSKLKYGPDDELLVFVAGHGMFRDIGRRGMGYLVCSNSESREGTPFYENPTLISFNTLRDALDNIPCEHIAVFIDACYGGCFADDLVTNRAAPLEGDMELTVTRLLERMTRRYFTSGGKQYVPDAGDDPNHSPFAGALLKALTSSNRDFLTADDLAVALAGLPKRYPRPKAGVFGDDAGGNFVFVRSKNQ